MQASHDPAPSEDLRTAILDVAEARFRAYGYGKTTMAEIAQDVSMSAANLYRYFENKQDLAAACANRCMGERLDHLRGVTRGKGQSAAKRLRLLAHEAFRHTLENTNKEQKINELVDIVARERQEIVHRFTEAHCALVAEVLAYGNERGEFAVDDVIKAARAVWTSLTLFTVPLFMGLHSAEEFETLLDGVVDLLLDGLRAR